MGGNPADYNLLFGITALQNDFITQDDLIQAMNEWVLEKSKSLAEILVARDALKPEYRDLLTALLAKRLEKFGNDPGKSLAAISSVGSLPAELARLSDADVRASLVHVSLGQSSVNGVSASDELCDQFESALRADERPTIEAYLVQVSEAHRDLLLKELLYFEVSYRCQHGEVPKFEEYVPRFPAHESVVVDVFHRSATINSATLDLSAVAGTQRVEAKARRTGLRFRIVSPHAKGGLGEVFVAHDQELNRQVALKQIQARYADNPKSRSRFLLEAEITGGLEHPGIVPIYGLGTYADGRPFYAMRFIRGDSLEDALRRYHSGVAEPRDAGERSLEFRKLLGRFLDVCHAIEYAHSRGVLHRDLKPGNIMLGQYGETLVVDWGLAKALGRHSVEDEHANGSAAEQTLHPSSGSGSAPTQMGQALGTPAYMSPEQAAGRLDLLAPASDVYCLGATLYCLLTGRPPFRGTDAMNILDQVRRGEFPRPRQIVRKADPALEAICLKAMALQPEDRYAAVAELSKDLERWLDEQPVSAWPEPWRVKAWRWMKRHRTLVTTTVAAAVVAVAGLTLATILLSAANEDLVAANLSERNATRRAKASELRANQQRDLAQRQEQTIREEKNQTEAAREKTAKALGVAQANLYVNRIGLAHQGWILNGPQVALPQLAQCPPELSDWEWRFLARLCQGGSLAKFNLDARAFDVKFSPDGLQLAIPCADGKVHVWDRMGKKEALALGDSSEPCLAVAYGSDGKFLAAGDKGGIVTIWDTSTGQRTRSFDTRNGRVIGLAISPDGKSLATTHDDSVNPDVAITIWDVNTGLKSFSLEGHTSSVYAVVFSPDGTRLASGSDDNSVKVWDLALHENTLTMQGNAAEIYAVAFSPDGQLIASGNHIETVDVWNAISGEKLHALRGHKDAIVSVAFSPDGKRLVSGSNDCTAKVWDLGTGQELFNLKGHGDHIVGVACSPDGDVIASASIDGAVRVWSAKNASDSPRVQSGRVLFSPDGERMALSQGNTIAIWDFESAPQARAVSPSLAGIQSLAYSHDGKRLAAGLSDGSIKIFDTETWQESVSYTGHSDIVWGLSFSPDGTQLASCSRDQFIKVWDTSAGELFFSRPIQSQNYNRNVAFSPDGRWLAYGSENDVVVWDAATGSEIMTLKGHSAGVITTVVSPDGKYLASASWDATVKIWDLKTRQLALTFEGHKSRVNSVSYSPDGKRIASGSFDHEVKIWDPRTGVELLTFREHNAPIRDVMFSGDGRRLAATDFGSDCRIWDATPLPEGIARGYLGIGALADKSTGELVIALVAPNSPADKAGLEPGDVILKLNGNSYVTLADLTKAMRAQQPGAQATVLIRRDGIKTSITMTADMRFN